MLMAGKVLDFWSFLNESKGETTKVIVLTGNTQGSKTSKSFAEQCEKRGVECYVVDVNQVVIEKVYNGHLLKTGEEGILIDPNSTIIVPRRGYVSPLSADKKPEILPAYMHKEPGDDTLTPEA
jgi:hypothetical protein